MQSEKRITVTKMCKTGTHSTAKSPYKMRKAELELPIPRVPLADPIDGLIKTDDLLDDVIVEITIWKGAKTNDSLHLTDRKSVV